MGDVSTWALPALLSFLGTMIAVFGWRSTLEIRNEAPSNRIDKRRPT